MKKVLIAATIGLFMAGMSSCGHGPGCDAYGGNQADYTKTKKDHAQKVALLQELSERTK